MHHTSHIWLNYIWTITIRLKAYVYCQWHLKPYLENSTSTRTLSEFHENPSHQETLQYYPVTRHKQNKERGDYPSIIYDKQWPGLITCPSFIMCNSHRADQGLVSHPRMSESLTKIRVLSTHAKISKETGADSLLSVWMELGSAVGRTCRR